MLLGELTERQNRFYQHTKNSYGRNIGYTGSQRQPTAKKVSGTNINSSRDTDKAVYQYQPTAKQTTSVNMHG